jgi:hypothetical protein
LQDGKPFDPTKPPPFDSRTASPEQLVAFYGNPNQDAPLTPDEKAPVPYKAMMAAMDSGNEKLAYQYARQYVRYMRNMSDRVGRTVQMQEVAVEREGIRPGNVQNNPYTKLLEADLESEESSNELSVAGLDPKAQRMIRQAQAEAMQEQSQLESKDTAPVDPQGEVNVLFFFDPTQRASYTRAKDVEALALKFARHTNVSFLALSSSNLTTAELLNFSEKSGLSLPVQNGGKAYGAFGGGTVPALLFVTKNSKKVVRVEDQLNILEMEATLKKMTGGK